MKKQLLIGARSFIRGLCVVALFGTAALALSCKDDKDPNADRDEFIQIYRNLADQEPDQANAGYYVDVTGGSFYFFVKSNVNYDLSWQDSEKTPWLEISSHEKNFKPGFDKITMEVQPLSKRTMYTRRVGTMIFNCPGIMFGRYLTIYQGAETRISENFSWLVYGSADPLNEDGEKSYSNWTKAQLDREWITTAPDCCFGKNGYVKLGDAQGCGADLITPYANDLNKDSLLMVSFRAVAYTSANNVADDKKLTVNILGGGAFLDTGLTTRQVAIGTYAVEDESVAGSMWDDSNYLLFIGNTQTNKISGNTRLQFVAGDLDTAGEKNNRVFIDNIYIYTLNMYNDEVIKQNEGTDKDIILSHLNENEL